jgi:hypothetical protein
MRIEHRPSGRPPKWPLVLLISLLIAGCNESIEAPDPVPPSGELTRCTEPRPESCAQVYQPVCATRDPDLRDDWETYSNGCVACADPRVHAHREGACELP